MTLPRMASSHYGAFWQTCLPPAEWTEATDAPPLPEQFESFEDPPTWVFPQVLLKFGPAGPGRAQIRSADGERIIQLQPNRFIYNWQRRSGEYPSYEGVYRGFETYFSQFEEFVRGRNLGSILPNQWEINYVNRIDPGPLWETPADWHKVIPGLLSPPPSSLPFTSGGLSGEWHYDLPGKQGRVHIAIGQGATDAHGAKSSLVLRTTVRGPVGEAGIRDWQAGFEIGHRAAGSAFTALTSSEAQHEWERMP
ncbi:Uncharacterized protein OS=Singulisphaera acidiphila (strain ATCC BAA-1392 / DSM 18658 / VKM B-2454 / MOB10) GN=Sinac_4195 PE=4 SV=1 [Gemmataceae bacterium]|nr:Uncharacterized protein OS=Singulisphaera acidiphila (strain ATCC BAA-1392 / DSM 18658 / VKM B-2454 / MOB10) GN=Sinac_4195 PE=4 SV=1 [Gemmataceae bacterium]VTU00669.1 Uncharacterized protein OS=Singulisphaera acidiphila (strain ATCC BAA-1392 / DSM 18658 / VKM B-2454 / MOB10) GN=Sinac_4195 PE=4 SV=1 [Gemmataceae bacterium]